MQNAQQLQGHSASRNHALGTVTAFTDAQAAVWRLTSDDPPKSRSGGAQATKALKGARWLTSGPNSPLRSQMPTEWSGSISGLSQGSLANVKCGFSKEVGRGQGLGQGEARLNQEPQVPP